jgi:hypothetical protein
VPDAGDETFEGLLREIAETPYVTGVPRKIQPGACLAGRFEVERRLGQGGMGQVFAVFDRVQRTEVAAKSLGRLTPQAIGHIKREFRAASDLVHPNLVHLHELLSDGDEWFFTMDLIDGVMLPDLLRDPSRQPLPPDFLFSVFRQLAQGLDALHQSGMLHRDLKPANFLVTGHHRVVLLDFGLARPLGLNQGADRSGTPFYMAPEQALGESLTQAADWYAFGVVMYEALTGGLPHGRPSAAALAAADVAPALAQLCLDLLAPRPEDRPSGAEVQERLGISALEDDVQRLPITATTLIGREAEAAQLEAAFDAMVAGRTTVALVEGPSGIGKTALVETFIARARARGAWVLTGRCRERESMGYKAVDGLIDGICELMQGLSEADALALLPPDIAHLAVLFPALRSAAAVAKRVRRRATPPDRTMVRQQAIAAWAAMLARFRQTAPLVIWIDDLQWSDADSALLLGPVLGGAAPVPLLFIGSQRGDQNAQGPLRG